MIRYRHQVTVSVTFWMWHSSCVPWCNVYIFLSIICLYLIEVLFATLFYILKKVCSDETGSSTPNTPQKGVLSQTGDGIPFIDESPVQMVQLRQKPKNNKVQREHRNSYISAVSNAKQSKYFASLESIHDIPPPSPSPEPLSQVNRNTDFDF